MLKTILPVLKATSRGTLVPVYLGGLCGSLLLMVIRPWFGLALAVILTAGYVLAKRYTAE